MLQPAGRLPGQQQQLQEVTTAATGKPKQPLPARGRHNSMRSALLPVRQPPPGQLQLPGLALSLSPKDFSKVSEMVARCRVWETAIKPD